MIIQPKPCTKSVCSFVSLCSDRQRRAPIRSQYWLAVYDCEGVPCALRAVCMPCGPAGIARGGNRPRRKTRGQFTGIGHMRQVLGVSLDDDDIVTGRPRSSYLVPASHAPGVHIPSKDNTIHPSNECWSIAHSDSDLSTARASIRPTFAPATLVSRHDGVHS
jgi:hypothetical protein